MPSNLEKIESILFNTINIFKENQINYWITDGTLLGIVREGSILPWDQEIDFGLWKSEVSEEKLINDFKKNGFKYIEYLPDAHCLVFLIDDIFIDINLYTKNNNKVSIKWATLPDNKIDKVIVRLINLLFESNKLNVRDKELSLRFLFKKIIRFFGFLISDSIKVKIYSYASNKYKYIGTSYPKELLKFRPIDFKGHEVMAPIDSEEYLRLTYGDNWKIPNKDYIWEQDTFNLELFHDEIKNK
tara:strand:+ start:8138 stop:8866 length:729 start_codon:yes stop_codon:yes gene_type:complete